MGLAQRALDEATKYSLERKTFGQPIFNVRPATEAYVLALAMAHALLREIYCYWLVLRLLYGF